jgi:hypothetical protein
MNEQPTAAPSTRPTDMRDSLNMLADADRHTEDVRRSTGHYRPLRALITVEDVQRWYEQSPQAEQPA